MGVLVGDLKMLFILVYLDNITVFSVPSHRILAIIFFVFDRLRAAGLKFKSYKCSFFQEEMEFFGHWVSREGITPLIKRWSLFRI